MNDEMDAVQWCVCVECDVLVVVVRGVVDSSSREIEILCLEFRRGCFALY